MNDGGDDTDYFSAYPMFDIPDLEQQSFSVLFLSSQEWTVSSEDQEVLNFGINGDKKFSDNVKSFNVDQDFITVFQNPSNIQCYQFNSLS